MDETSAGAVIFRETARGRMFLLLHYPSGHWDFVKGKLERGESARQTTIREAREETGISDLEFIGGFEETIRYDFQFGGEPVHKTVVFYLARTRTRRVVISHEHLGYAWMDLKAAIGRVTYRNAKSLLRAADRTLGPAG